MIKVQPTRIAVVCEFPLLFDRWVRELGLPISRFERGYKAVAMGTLVFYRVHEKNPDVFEGMTYDGAIWLTSMAPQYEAMLARCLRPRTM